MDSPDTQYDLAELCAHAGVTARTVRYYIQQGLLPQPGAGREARKYSAGHLDRLRLVRRLQREHLPLAEIRARLASLSDEAVAGLLPPADAGAPPLTAREYLDQVLGLAAGNPAQPSRHGIDASRVPRASAPSPVSPAPGTALVATQHQVSSEPDAVWPRSREQWERLRLHDDIELCVRRPVSRDMNRRLERLLAAARRILHDD